MFDRQYSRVIDEFLMKMSHVTHELNSDTGEAMRDICALLRVGRVESFFYESERNEEMEFGTKAILFTQPEYEEEIQFSHRYVSGSNEGIAIYKLYGIAGMDGWNEQEREKLPILTLMLFQFHGRIRTSRMVKRLSNYDHDLGVYNMNYFNKMVNTWIIDKTIYQYGSVYFNLKNFSAVNQQYGRETGTFVMKQFVSDLQHMLGETGIVSRVGGDNFVCIFPASALNDVRSYLLGRSVLVDKSGKFAWIYASAGFYMMDDEVKLASDVMDRLTITIQKAKNMPEEGYIAFYDRKLQQNISHVKNMQKLFPIAIEQEEFQVYYQPKVQLDNYCLQGAEALCRWIRDGEIVPPGEFIPILEQGQEICTLDFYMLEHVCRDIRRWLDEGRRVVKVSVNLSRKHLDDPLLLEHILEIVDQYDVPHEYIEIELTETTTEVDFHMIKQLVIALRQHGIWTAVDDFGTGYSSLNLIREAPWNVLKIDRSFLPGRMSAGEVKEQIAMLKDLIILARDLGMECIVEGVETIEQVQLLKKLECYQAQGFYFDRPLRVEDFERRLMEAML